MLANLVNLTPHEIELRSPDGSTVSIKQGGNPIRLDEVRRPQGFVNGIPLVDKSFSKGGLPPEVADTFYIVSLPVALAFPERTDLLVTDGYKRDRSGRILGATALARIVSYEK